MSILTAKHIMMRMSTTLRLLANSTHLETLRISFTLTIQSISRLCLTHHSVSTQTAVITPKWNRMKSYQLFMKHRKLEVGRKKKNCKNNGDVVRPNSKWSSLLRIRETLEMVHQEIKQSCLLSQNRVSG